MTQHAMNRRMFLMAIASFFASRAVKVCAGEKEEELERQMKQLASLVKHDQKWGHRELPKFLESLPDEIMLQLMKNLDLRKARETVSDLSARSDDVRAVLEHFVWVSYHSFEYWFTDPYRVNYHEIVEWVANKLAVPQENIEKRSTFEIEQAICVQLFAKIWDKLNKEQRLQILNELDKKGAIEDKVGIAALSGAGAIAALSSTVYFAGFTFYTTMSTVVSTAAGLLGVTLPFGLYQGLSSLVAFLSGPFGLLLGVILGGLGAGALGRADPIKSAKFICQIHTIKVAALKAAGMKEEMIFPSRHERK